MLYRDIIFIRFRELAGLDGQDAPLWRALCESAARTVEERLRDGLDLAAEMERLCFAAAGIAHVRYLLCARSHSSGEELRVGDIALKSSVSSGTEAPGEDVFLRQISDLLRPEGFVFATIGEAGL